MRISTDRFLRAAFALALVVLASMGGPAAASTTASSHRIHASTPAIQGPKATLSYVVTPLVSDGSLDAPVQDTNLVNPWGLARGVSGPFWVSDNGTDTATLYDGDGVPNPLVVALPAGAAPTAVTFNGGASFIVDNGVNTGPARFIFAGEDGGIYGWNPGVPPPSPSHVAFRLHDDAASGAIYKGITEASTGAGDRLYVTDFHNRKVNVYDPGFAPADLPEGAFVDPRIPDDFGPFGIQNIEGRIFVTYAKLDDEGEDDVAGQGLGFVSAFDTDGRFLARIATRGLLNSPFGLARAPQGFGRFGGDLLVGNFGDGRILAFRLSDDLRRSAVDGLLTGADRRPIAIEGLWSLVFGNGQGAGSPDQLFFTAGPGDEAHGLFGRIEAH